MGIITRLLEPDIGAVYPEPTADFWYTDTGNASFTGTVVTHETALRVSTVFACVSAIARDIATMPLHLYRRLPDGGRERATELALYSILNHRPNIWQTTQEWVEMMVGHLLLRGNSYNIIESGRPGFAEQLIPLNPARMKVEQLPSNRLLYTYHWEDGSQEVFTQDEIFHIKGLSSDGIVGLSVVGLAREAFGLGLATEQYAARFFGQSAEPRGVLKLDGRLTQEQADRLGSRWQAAHGGLTGSHKTAVLEHGVTWQQVGMSNDDSQFLQSRSFQVEEMARWFHMPLGRIGHTEKATTWGTGLEQSNIWYITYALLPWIRRIEGRILRDLIFDTRNLYAEFLMNHLLRGDTTSRFNAYKVAIDTGWMSPNEVREMENMNPREGLDGTRIQQNMAIIDEDGEIRRINEPTSPPSFDNQPPVQDEEQSARFRLLVGQLAAFSVRREITTVKKLRRRHEDEPDLLSGALDEFYWQHAELVAKDLCISPDAAAEYCQRQRETEGLDEEAKISELVELALAGDGNG